MWELRQVRVAMCESCNLWKLKHLELQFAGVARSWSFSVWNFWCVEVKMCGAALCVKSALCVGLVMRADCILCCVVHELQFVEVKVRGS